DARCGEVRAVEDGRLLPAAVGTEVHAPRRRIAAASPVDPESFRHPRPVGEALGDDAEAHDLDGLVGPALCPYVRSCSCPKASARAATVLRSTEPPVTGTVSSND